MNSVAKSALLVVLLLTAAAPGETTPETQPAAPPARKPLAVIERIAAEDGVVVAKLSNHLTVILKPARTAPVVCVRGYVRAGGLYEREWLGCGISHLTEHLIAEGAVHEMGPGGTAKEAKQTSDRVKEIGGQSNAYTSLDHTCYYISATAGKAMECIDLLGDWLARPKIAEEDFRREHGVVQREQEMGKDEPSRQIWYAHAENAFARHPAGVPVIGYKAPLSRLEHKDILTYVGRMYIPQNMVVVVVGDIDTEKVLDRIRHAFAGFDTGRLPDLSLPDVPAIAGVRRVRRDHPGLKESIQRLSFQTIPLIHKDLHALDVLSYVLTKGRSSRLVRKIEREKKLVTSISSSSWTPAWGDGLFTISFRASTENADPAETAILDELKKIVTEGVAPEELARAKRQKVADFVYDQQTVESQAATLGTDYLTTGDVGFSRRYTERIQAVTGEQVQKVAKKYFAFDRMAITRLVPVRKQAPTTAPGPETPETAVRFFTLPNGLRVVLHPTGARGKGAAGEASGIVAMTFATTGGLLLEDEKTNGMGTLMASLSTKGAADRTADQIAAFFDRAGGRISGNCGNNTFYWQGVVLDDSFPQALEIFSDVIQRPMFSQDELDKLRPVLLASISRIDERWSSQMQKFFRGKFFIGSPYGMLSAGSKKVVEAATTDQIAAYHRRSIGGGSSVLAIYGNFDAAAAKGQVEKLFAGLSESKADLRIPASRSVQPDGELHVLETKKEVSAIVVAAPGMKIDNMEDRFAITVLDTIISGYHLPGGWLHDELRGKQLVYVVHAYNWVGLAPGAFVTYAAAQPDKAPQVIEIIQRNLARAAQYRPTQREIDLAVNAILTAELLDNQSMAALSMSAALDELYGFGYDFRKKLERHYREVRPEDVERVGKKYLSGGFVVTVTTPRPEAFQPADQGSE